LSAELNARGYKENPILFCPLDDGRQELGDERHDRFGRALGPGTTTLFGGNQNNGPLLGGRFTLGVGSTLAKRSGLKGATSS